MKAPRTAKFTVIALLFLATQMPSLLAEDLTVDAAVSQWSEQTKIVVTKDMRLALLASIGNDFARRAAGVGFAAADVDMLKDTIETHGGVNLGLGGTWGTVSSIEEPNSVVRLMNHDQAPFVASVFEISIIGPTLSRFPDIRLNVVPVPPRDYRVQINGESYEATEESIYGVAPGSVEIKVIRGSSPPCTWSGTVVEGDVKDVDCKF